MHLSGIAFLLLLAGSSVRTAAAARIPLRPNLTVEEPVVAEVVFSNGTVEAFAAAPPEGDQNASQVSPEGVATEVLQPRLRQNSSEVSGASVPSLNSTVQGAVPEKQQALQPSNVTQLALPQANATIGAVKVMEASGVLPWWQSNWFSKHMPWTWSLMQTLSFAMIVKALCMAGNVLVQISPFPQVKRWELRGDTGETDSAPYLAICFGGWQWCFYGSFAWLVTGQSGFLILVHSNCLGALLGTYYLVVFYKNCRFDSSRACLQKYLSGVATLVVFQVCCIAALPARRALMISGLIGSFCSFMGAMSMLVMVPAAIRTKDTRSIPGLLIGANFASALVWCACGLMLGDYLVVGPNIAAAFSSCCCLCLKVMYPSQDDLPQSKQKDFDLQSLSTEETPLKVKMLNPGSLGPSGCQDSADTGGTF